MLVIAAICHLFLIVSSYLIFKALTYEDPPALPKRHEVRCGHPLCALCHRPSPKLPRTPPDEYKPKNEEPYR